MKPRLRPTYARKNYKWPEDAPVFVVTGNRVRGCTPAEGDRLRLAVQRRLNQENSAETMT